MPKYSETEELTGLASELLTHIDVLTQRFLLHKTADLSRTELAVLRTLADGPATMSEVTNSLGMACSSATGVVDRLVDRGLAERTRPDEDRRTVNVALTKRGRHLYDHHTEDRLNLGRGMLEPLEPAERRQLLALFRKITNR
ncbi:MAG TPA: MarR family transcriptional regulator [Thermoanaerobaculia bacterium]|nr:MarR family transcriptional regulator [Thermoanaerobaculia bacterium]